MRLCSAAGLSRKTPPQSPQQRPNVIITPPTAPARRSGAAGAFDVLNAVFADRKSCLCGVFALLAAAAALASGTVEAAAPATTAALEEEALARTQAEEAADEKRRAKPAEVTSDGRRIITIAVTDALEGVTDDTGIRDTIAALADALPGYSVRKTTLVAADALSQISEIRPDFVIASTGTSAFFAHASDSPYRIATRKSAAAKSVSRSIGSTIVALKSRTDINTLADLKGRTVAATLPTSISGWLAVAGNEAFARLNQIADSVKPEGLGMGLSIVRGICDSHAATLNFRRNPAGGVTTRVVFAAADPDNSNKESSAS